MEVIMNPMLPSLTLLIMVWFMVITSFSTSSSSSSSDYNFTIAKPGCRDRCGDVRVPFPFGIGEGCYDERSPNFLVKCNSSGQLNFPWSEVKITNISLEGQFRTSTYVAYDCYDKQTHQRLRYNDTWSQVPQPFTFNSTANKLTVVGCDSVAVVQGLSELRYYQTGCWSVCYEKNDAEIENGSCSGIGCCQTSIPSGAWQVNVSMRSTLNHSLVSSFNPCGYAFLVADDAFQFSADNLTNLDKVETLPVIVDWVISDNSCEEAKTNMSSYACGLNSECYDPKGALGYRCRCNPGYEGNPYLPNGCQDIDECSRNPNTCGVNSVCINKPGRHECHCNRGYHKDGHRCVANSKNNNWIIITALCLSAGSVSLLILSFCVYYQWNRLMQKRLREEFFKKNGGLILQQKLGTEKGGGTYSTRIFAYEELQKATNDFSESQILGRGGFGTVYKGELIDKTIVAIKKSRGVDEKQVEQFINEVMLLSQINSRNVVKLLGCCLETEAPLLVYEYINNGTLYEHLHNNAKASKLTWNIRLRIASEIAGVLSYLHSIASPPIIHRDIKSANILLDQSYTAKVSDFGTSRLVPLDDDQVFTMVHGTIGYLDPEYMQTGLLTEKSDVYSFGIVLIELITGKQVLDLDKPDGEKFLSNGFLASLKENHLAQVIDSNIFCHEDLDMDQLTEVSMIAKRCISMRCEDRPSMKDVERELFVLGAEANQVSAQAFEIDYLSKDENGSCEDATSTGQYSAVYIATSQPLLDIYGGR